MKHLLTIQEISHFHNGKIIWHATNIKNILHAQGEEYMLRALFKILDVSVPTFYYLGLDNRTTPDDEDTLPVNAEPSTHGYSRQAVSSASGFTIEEVNTIWRATSNTVSFSASAGAWGPIQNLFITDRIDNAGFLIASAALGSQRTLNSGDTLSLKFILEVKDTTI